MAYKASDYGSVKDFVFGVSKSGYIELVKRHNIELDFFTTTP